LRESILTPEPSRPNQNYLPTPQVRRDVPIGYIDAGFMVAS
jgi:hypothetical protein